jgi:hypothetical protein
MAIGGRLCGFSALIGLFFVSMEPSVVLKNLDVTKRRATNASMIWFVSLELGG